MTTANARRFFGLTATLLSFITLCAAATAQNLPADLLSIDRSAPLLALQGEVLQGEAPTAADTTVKTERGAYDKWFGIGACLASTSIINGAITDANAVLGYGLWLTITPLQSLKVDWFQLDLTYTYSRNTQLRDSLYEALTKQQLAPPNDHKQLGINARFIGNPKSIVNFYATIGMTYFHNEFGLDRWVIESITETQLTEYVEDAWGLSGSLGVSVNVSTPYGVIAPTAEWYVGRILGDRPLPQRQGEFFLSQPRIGLLFYPSLSKLF